MSQNYKALLKRIYGSQKINIHPQTLASLVLLSHFDNNTNSNDIETVIGGENGIWSRIQNLEQDLANSKHFRGAYFSWDEITKIKNPRPGDYAIWKRKNEDDIFAIFDVTSEEKPDGTYDGNWREVGHVYQSAVTSVNGEIGDVILNGDNILSSYDSSGNVKKISEIFKSITSFVNDHEGDINLLIEQTEILSQKDSELDKEITNLKAKDEELQKLIDELEESIGIVQENSLEFKGDWTNGSIYNLNDIVKYGKHLYISQKDGVTSEPTAGLENGDWKVFVEGFSGKYSDLTGVPEDLINQTQLENAIKEAVGDIDVSEQISAHNNDKEAHPYIRELIETAKNDIINMLPTVTILEE